MNKKIIFTIFDCVLYSLSYFSAFLCLLTCSLVDECFLLYADIYYSYSQTAIRKTVLFFFFFYLLFLLLSFFISRYRYKHFGCNRKKCLYRKDLSLFSKDYS